MLRGARRAIVAIRERFGRRVLSWNVFCAQAVAPKILGMTSVRSAGQTRRRPSRVLVIAWPPVASDCYTMSKISLRVSGGIPVRAGVAGVGSADMVKV